VYSLYADLCAGRVGMEDLAQVLEQAALREQDIAALLRSAAEMPKRDHCRRILIHLDRMSPLEPFAVYGPRVCPFYNYFQAALVLLELGALDAPAALRVGGDLVIGQSFTAEALLASHLELLRRGQVGAASTERVLDALARTDELGFGPVGAALAAYGRELARSPRERVQVLDPGPLDYAALLARERTAARAAKLRVLGRR
jgi:hypothetical protein